MHILSHTTLFLVSTCLSKSALGDYLGPRYPAPSDISSGSSLVAASWKNVTSTIQAYLDADTPETAMVKNVTFSLGMFSTHDPKASGLQFHYTSPEIANARNGTHKVDANSIYRIASVSKMISVLTAMLNLKPEDWEKPFSDIFPNLKKIKGNDVDTVQWDKITLSALGAQIAGVPRDGFPFNIGELLLIPLLTGQLTSSGTFDFSNYTAIGLPPIKKGDKTAFPACASTKYLLSANPVCPAEPYVDGVAKEPPTFLPWSSPGYANDGFVLFGAGVAKLTGKSWDEMYRKSVFEPLGMSSSNSSTPPVSEWSRSVIPGKPEEGFAIDAGIAVASGGLLSTTSDLAKLGIGILDSTLLSPDQTRRWMKPVSHTARLQYAVGRPWEILRYTHASGAVTDIYTKSGDSGAYSSYMVLLPDYNAGFSILSASTDPARLQVVLLISDLIAETVIPALEAQAAVEAEKNFGGAYSADYGLKSSLTLSLNKTADAAPGLHISSWISNGTDVLTSFLQESQMAPPYRLLPSISDSKAGKIGFQLVTSADAPNDPTHIGLFTRNMKADWFGVGALTYGGVAVSLFEFDVGKDGKAVTASPAAFRVKFKRSG